jgi:hypothetical protein
MNRMTPAWPTRSRELGSLRRLARSGLLGILIFVLSRRYDKVFRMPIE